MIDTNNPIIREAYDLGHRHGFLQGQMIAEEDPSGQVQKILEIFKQLPEDQRELVKLLLTATEVPLSSGIAEAYRVPVALNDVQCEIVKKHLAKKLERKKIKTRE